MKTKLFLLMIAISAITFNGCKKDDDSAYQPKGTYGNANVKSVTFSGSLSWDATNYWRTGTWTNISILTSSVVNTGSVMLYQSVGSGSWVALPITQALGGNVVEDDWFQYSAGQISVVIENSDLSDPTPPALTYKLVCIDAAARHSNPNLDLTDYKAVAKAFNLKD